ncbi:hypothetical protein HS088_TW20G00037 [Tripterygium wilfordii]|uniref:BUD13 n=1 Tax=Tripterygium wilfordii TaxID=458696 RepID=A0A7J7C690_TRIWF|nr:BUD13 homolog [Tripterygium wilfordii]KAF5729673.1 hypothetical protein HS088_TW20G00037 [Tripterygium wilfordii]
MAALTSGSKPLKEYLKRYESKNEEEKRRKKKKKKSKPVATGVLVVDEDPVWQKAVNLEEDNGDESADEDKPQVDEDVEAQRVMRLEQLMARRAYNAIADDGSGWVSLSPKQNDIGDRNIDISPPRRQRARNDTPSPERQRMSSGDGRENMDLAPLRQQQTDNKSGLHEHDADPAQTTVLSPDLSLPHKRRLMNDTLSPEYKSKHSREDLDLSPPRQQRKANYSPSPQPEVKSLRSTGLNNDLSPRRRRRVRNDTTEPELMPARPDTDLSPPRQRRKRYCTPSPDPHTKSASHAGKNSDISPPRRSHSRTSESHERKKPENLPDITRRQRGPYEGDADGNLKPDLSPPRKGRNLSPQHSHRRSLEKNTSRVSLVEDLSPPRKNDKVNLGPASSRAESKTGLITGRDVREQIFKAKKEDVLRFEQMDPSISGRGAEPVYRDKKGERISKEEFLKSKQKIEEKPKEKKLEWGKGLAQKREAEARLQEFEVEKDKPFARTRDDPELDKMMKDRVRWGDPMAHLVKKKHSELVLPDLGDNEKMKESGFIVPQDVPSHSWMKRGLDAAPNRYGIKPGRHWDGVDRSNGFEKQMFKRTNEKQATEREAYLWSVSDM